MESSYDVERTQGALSKTINITAYDNELLVGCLRILTDGYYFGTITELLVLPEYQKQGVGSKLLQLAKDNTPTMLYFGAQPGIEKCVDDGEDQGEKHGIPHLRRGDVAELLKCRSAVEIGGFVLLRGDGDEPCEQQNNAVPRVFPEVHEDHDPEGVFAVQPLDDGQV